MVSCYTTLVPSLGLHTRPACEAASALVCEGSVCLPIKERKKERNETALEGRKDGGREGGRNEGRKEQRKERKNE